MARGKFITYMQSANIAGQYTNDLSGCAEGGSISPITNVETGNHRPVG